MGGTFEACISSYFEVFRRGSRRGMHGDGDDRGLHDRQIPLLLLGTALRRTLLYALSMIEFNFLLDINF